MTATNITPIEMWEESAYGVLSIFTISGFVGSVIMFSHMILFHSIFSYIYLVSAIVLLAGAIGINYLKSSRFGNRNLSLGERVAQLERRSPAA